METTSYRSTYPARGSGPPEFKNLFDEHSLTIANFFQKYFKNWRGGGKLLLKNVGVQ